MGAREFELPEVKLLMDAVQSSRFLTQKKSDALIRKLERLASVHLFWFGLFAIDNLLLFRSHTPA